MRRARPAQPNDIPALVDLWNASYPQRPVSTDRFTPDKLTCTDESGRIVLEVDGRLVGVGQYTLSRRKDDPPGKYWGYATVHPDHRTEELASSLHRALMSHLAELEGRCLYTMVQETITERVGTLERLGFLETLRSYGANLDVSAFDSTRFDVRGLEAQLARQGICIRTLEALQNDPHHVTKLYDLYQETYHDIPEVGFDSLKSPEVFRARLTQENQPPDAFFVAVAEGRYVGYSNLLVNEANACLDQQATAVRRVYRRKGIARLLKLRGIAYAKAHGIATINTGMASDNRAMVALNLGLGFVPEPHWITFRKDLRTDT